ncbi:MAG TPA: YciI family protein [Sphingomonas sp.]|nr:YciI family protein [Sphingomonas sp.]
MKFLCLCRYELAAYARLTPDDFRKIALLCAPHDAALRESGQVALIGSLTTPDDAKVLRAAADGAVLIEDGPYHDDPEPVSAFFIVEAETTDQAVEIARLHPEAHLGTRFGKGGIEIFPIWDLWSRPA